jgi:hypothetical protein
MSEPMEVAVKVAKGLNTNERKAIRDAAEIVYQKITRDDEVSKAVQVVLIHAQRAWGDDLFDTKLQFGADQAARMDERTRGIMFGVDDVATQLMDPNHLVNLIQVLQEKHDGPRD